jgi:hypothetical protein
MQQHLASKKHKEKQLAWQDLLAQSCSDEHHPGSGEQDAACDLVQDAAFDESDDEFEAQLQQLSLRGGQEQQTKAQESELAAASSSSSEEELSGVLSKKKKKKKAKKGVFGDVVEVAVAAQSAAAVSFEDCEDEVGCRDPVVDKKMTKKQIRR